MTEETQETDEPIAEVEPDEVVNEPSETPDDTPEAPEVEADDGVTVSFGDEEPEPQAVQEQAPQWVKDLRKANRQLARENRELKQSKSVPAPEPVTVGPEPKLEDFGYDEDAFKAAVREHVAKEAQVKAQKKKAEDEAQAARDAWAKQVQGYQTAKQALKVPDFDDAEEAVTSTLSEAQQGYLLVAAERPAEMVYALGKSKAKAAALASITDPLKFAAQVARLETQMKVVPRKTAPKPESVVRSTVPNASLGSDAALKKLRDKAEKTGDLSEVIAYKRQLRERAKK